MGYTWVAFGAGMLSALLTCRLTHETWSMPVAIKLSHWALTTTDGTGFIYRTGLLVSLIQMFGNVVYSSPGQRNLKATMERNFAVSVSMAHIIPLWYVSELAVSHDS